MIIKKILIPLDGSRLAEAALAPALKLAGASAGSAILLHCILPAELFSLTSAQMVKKERDRAAKYLHDLAIGLRKGGANVVEKIVTGDPARSILSEAKLCGADLIALSSHGRGGAQGWPFGSVTERVLRLATLPVLVFRGENSAPRDIRRILIASDGSEASLEVVLPASQLASALGASVVLVHVGARLPVVVQAAVRSINAQAIPVTTRLLHGDATKSIAAVAQEAGTDLLAITAPRSSQAGGTLLGPVGDALLSATGQPLLVVRAPKAA
jgi:nucleotide-binding universal stress UspA family protein